jgi:hypothetical protein
MNLEPSGGGVRKAEREGEGNGAAHWVQFQRCLNHTEARIRESRGASATLPSGCHEESRTATSVLEQSSKMAASSV